MSRKATLGVTIAVLALVVVWIGYRGRPGGQVVHSEKATPAESVEPTLALGQEGPAPEPNAPTLRKPDDVAPGGKNDKTALTLSKDANDQPETTQPTQPEPIAAGPSATEGGGRNPSTTSAKTRGPEVIAFTGTRPNARRPLPQNSGSSVGQIIAPPAKDGREKRIFYVHDTYRHPDGSQDVYELTVGPDGKVLSERKIRQKDGQSQVVSEVTLHDLESQRVVDLVMAFSQARQSGQVPREELAAIRRRMLAAAELHPEDPESAEAYLQAAWSARDEEEAKRYLQMILKHPSARPDTKLMALLDLPWAADTIQERFDYLNLRARIIAEEVPKGNLRDSWLVHMYDVPLNKAMFLQIYLYRHKRLPELTGEDAGKQVSDYYQDYLDNTPPEVIERFGDLLPDRPTAIKNMADAFRRQEQYEQAAATYAELLEMPDNPYPPTQVRYWIALARYPEGGPEFCQALEAIESECPPDEWSDNLHSNIAICWLMEFRGRPYLELRETMAKEPIDIAQISPEKAEGRLIVLKNLALSCTMDDVNDKERAIAYYEQFLFECNELRTAYAENANWTSTLSNIDRMRSGVLSILGNLYYLFGREDMALSTYRTIINDYPGSIHEKTALEKIKQIENSGRQK